jgi:hypothetical protein
MFTIFQDTSIEDLSTFPENIAFKAFQTFQCLQIIRLAVVKKLEQHCTAQITFPEVSRTLSATLSQSSTTTRSGSSSPHED